MTFKPRRPAVNSLKPPANWLRFRLWPTWPFPPSTQRGSDLIQIALIGCGGRGGGAAANALSVKRGPIKLVAMADLFPERLEKDLNHSEAEVRKPGGRAAGSPVPGLRRLQESDGLSEAGRRRHFRHAAGVSLGAFHLRHREGPECLYGEAGHRGRPHQQTHAQRSRKTPPPRTSKWGWD